MGFLGESQQLFYLDAGGQLAAHARIESRPRSGEAWQYVFFVDLEGHEEDPPVRRALADLERRSDMVKVFGSYPRARSRR